MILKRKFLLLILLCWPLAGIAYDTETITETNTITEGTKTVNEITTIIKPRAPELAALIEAAGDVEKKGSIKKASEALMNACKELETYYKDIETVDKNIVTAKMAECEKALEEAKCTPVTSKCPDGTTGTTPPNCRCIDDENYTYDPVKNECVVNRLKELEEAYKAAKEKEQSLANRTLTAVTTAATGIGGMELAMGLAQQSADAAADQDMAAYLATFRCTYGNTVQVKGGPEVVELPGGNDPEMMSLRSEYFALAADLKERKEALGMKPGIESEEILDKSQMGLYDDESLPITTGAYGSLYRAKMLESIEDQEKIDAERQASENRVIAGGVLVGAGTLIGVIGNSMINGKLNELIKSKKCKNLEAEYNNQTTALKDLQRCLRSAGVKDVDKLTMSYLAPFMPSVLSVSSINCSTDLAQGKGKPATTLFMGVNTKSNDRGTIILNKLIASFGKEATGKLIGTSTLNETYAANVIETALSNVEIRFESAMNADQENGCNTSVIMEKVK